ncbi:ATP-binding protein [Corallococcus macrosporus]|uniref:histidine kinase n=1 Tax=Myxococcus fulvus (strain ATCC BAA-855 / HW-1) TaxID=483219 RepID=F8CHI1_MYXFH|nr:ATP-binding protein [Corallococcus macrosporus]AEI67482.1 sensory box sensor histidine kinase [Corallococcus macrosporus]
MKFLCLTSDTRHPVVEELRRQGQGVCVTADLVEAGAALGHGPVDVLVVDAADLTKGARWLDTLRTWARPEEPLVLGLAPAATDEALEPLLAAGVDEFLVEPFCAVQVRARRVLLERRVAARRQRRTSEAEARGELERLASIIQAQSDVAMAGFGLDELMRLLCERSRVLCGADGAAVALLEPDADEVNYLVATGSLAPFIGFRLKVEGSLTGTSLVRGEVMRTDDSEADVRVNVTALRQVGARSMICVPLWREGRPVGALNVTSRRPNAFDDRDVRTLELMAGMLGAAMGNAAEAQARQELMAQNTLALGALEESQELFASFMDNIPAVAFMKDEQGRRLWVNARYCRFFGYPPGTDMSQVADLDLMPPASAEQSRRDDEAVLSSGRQSITESMIPAPDGTERHWLTYRFIVRERSGRRLLAGVAMDITDRKAMQAQLVVSDRLAAVGTLAAGVAHEINNPLAFVLSNLSFLTGELHALTRELPSGRVAELEEVLRDATDGAHRVRQIVRDLRTFSRGDDEVATAVNVQAVLESAITLARSELKQRAQIVRDYREVPLVEGNEGRFGQVFLNLLINAAQAIPPGQPERHEVRLSLETAGDRVIIEVRDTGMGMPPAVRARIFDPFFTTKPVGEGTGLGLSICHGIVTGFGGDISVESEEGRGSTFRVSLPVVRRALEPPPRMPLVG